VPVVIYNVSISLDGFCAGVDQSIEHPLGIGGEKLHIWIRELAAWRKSAGLSGGAENENTAVLERDDDLGALVMGRNMFGGGPGPWSDWRGWWGEDPPFHLPVYVVTHYPREVLVMGDTSFTFVTDGPERALELAKDRAGNRNVGVCGGASTARALLYRGLIDEMMFHIVPTTLGAGVRLFELGGEPMSFQQKSVAEGPGVLHVVYTVQHT